MEDKIMSKYEKNEKQKLKDYIDANRNAFDDEEILNDTNIFESGYINSTFAIKLLAYLASNYDVEIPDSEIKLDNFSTVNAMMNMVESLKEPINEV